MPKGAQAFRTIREVADWLGVAAHVLRFWESRFPQIQPVKRAGGRRYYRPTDMKLIGGIKVLLHDNGYTIRGAQRIIRDDGVAAVAAMSPPLEAEPEGAAPARADAEGTEAEAADAAAGTAAPAGTASEQSPLPFDSEPAPHDAPASATGTGSVAADDALARLARLTATAPISESTERAVTDALATTRPLAARMSGRPDA